MLYEATADEVYLKAARDYLDLALSCEDNLRSSPTSHKVAWGAAVLARITSDPRCTELAVTIADHLLAIQDPSGAWLVNQPTHTTFDQTAEISIWLQESAPSCSPCSRPGTLKKQAHRHVLGSTPRPVPRPLSARRWVMVRTMVTDMAGSSVNSRAISSSRARSTCAWSRNASTSPSRQQIRMSRGPRLRSSVSTDSQNVSPFQHHSARLLVGIRG